MDEIKFRERIPFVSETSRRIHYRYRINIIKDPIGSIQLYLPNEFDLLSAASAINQRP